MLKNAVELAGGMSLQNVVAGFSACGIFPFDPQRVLNKLPVPLDEDEERERSWTDTFVQHLEELRHPSPGTVPARRGKPLNVEAAKSVVVPDEAEDEAAGETDSENGSSRSSSDESLEKSADESDGSRPDESTSELDEDFQEGDYVVVELEAETGTGKHYLGVITEDLTDRGETGVDYKVKCMRSKKGREGT